jgi:hypothetical protein
MNQEQQEFTFDDADPVQECTFFAIVGNKGCQVMSSFKGGSKACLCNGECSQVHTLFADCSCCVVHTCLIKYNGCIHFRKTVRFSACRNKNALFFIPFLKIYAG